MDLTASFQADDHEVLGTSFLVVEVDAEAGQMRVAQREGAGWGPNMGVWDLSLPWGGSAATPAPAITTRAMANMLNPTRWGWWDWPEVLVRWWRGRKVSMAAARVGVYVLQSN